MTFILPEQMFQIALLLNKNKMCHIILKPMNNCSVPEYQTEK